MKIDTLSFYSSVDPKLMRKTLLKGTLFAFLGLVPVFYASLYLTVPELSYWGVFIFFSGLFMIAAGMVPFRRLSLLEKKPNLLTLVCNDEEKHGTNEQTYEKYELFYFQKGRKILTIPFSSIQKMEYYKKKHLYGILLFLKEMPKERIIVHTNKFDFIRYRKHCGKTFECDLFIPYFSFRSYKELQAAIDESPSKDADCYPF